MQRTAEQEAVIQAVTEGKNVCVEALAGTGKSTTLRLLAESLPDRQFLYLCFNRSVKEEAKGKMPPNCRCETTHSLAWQYTNPLLTQRVLTPTMKPADVSKLLNLPRIRIVTPGTSRVRIIQPVRLLSAVRRSLTAFCISNDPQPSHKHFTSEPMYLDMLSAKLVYIGSQKEAVDDIDSFWLQWLRRLWADVMDPDGVSRVMHDDYLKAWILTAPDLSTMCTCLLCDESQDLNLVTIQLLESQPSEIQRVFVGDSNQGLYRFRGGADRMKDLCAIDVWLPLTQTWRFGGHIADAANRILTLLGSPKTVKPETATSSVVTSNNTLQKPRCRLFRTNQGLIGTLLQLLNDSSLQYKVVVHSNFKEGLIRFLESAHWLQYGKNSGVSTPDVLHEDIACHETWQDFLQELSMNHRGHIKAMLAFADAQGGFLRAQEAVDSLLTDPPEVGDYCWLITTHLAKGLEWDTVTLSNDFKALQSKCSDEALVDEYRVLYVAVTRARLCLDVGQHKWLIAPKRVEREHVQL